MQAPRGTFLAYSTAPGAVAFDGDAGNSPFTAALASELKTPGVAIEQMFKNVRIAVLAETGGRQTPWDSSSLTGDFSFVAKKPMSPEEIEELQLWESIQVSRDPVQVMLFLRAYPGSKLVPAARALLAEAMQEELENADSAGQEPSATVLADPDAADRAAFEDAQQRASIEGYRSYLAAFPQGVFTEFAQTEIAALEAKQTKDPLAGTQMTPSRPRPSRKSQQRRAMPIRSARSGSMWPWPAAARRFRA